MIWSSTRLLRANLRRDLAQKSGPTPLSYANWSKAHPRTVHFPIQIDQNSVGRLFGARPRRRNDGICLVLLQITRDLLLRSRFEVYSRNFTPFRHRLHACKNHPEMYLKPPLCGELSGSRNRVFFSLRFLEFQKKNGQIRCGCKSLVCRA